jgi:hypothetical protein
MVYIEYMEKMIWNSEDHRFAADTTTLYDNKRGIANSIRNIEEAQKLAAAIVRLEDQRRAEALL